MATVRATPTVFIVDDDDSVRESLCAAFQSAGIQCESFATGEEFLAQFDPEWTGCVILDLRLSRMHGLEVQAELAARGSRLPVVVLSAFIDVPTAVKAVKSGAVDVFEKPLDGYALLERVRPIIEREMASREKSAFSNRAATLSDRQREIMALLLLGKRTKEIARDLNISPKTVEKHRANVLSKMQAESVIDLMRQKLDDLGR
ncbi:MAG TPA: response regulator [Pirellulales bacterium]|nr:response regulator [Pirellulales bacterium]